MSAEELERLRRRGIELEAEIERLREEGRQGRAILDSAVDFAIVAADRDGRVTRWNTGATRTLGWTADEMLGRRLHRFFTPEDRSAGRVEAEMRDSLLHGRAGDERWHLRKSGDRFWAAGEMMPLRGGAGEHLGFLKILRDRTAEHLAGEALRDSEARLDRAQEAGGVGVFSLDVASDVVTPSAQFCRLFGLAARDNRPASAFTDLIDPEDRAALSTAEGRRSGKVPRDVAYRIRRADTGAVRWIARRAELERDGDGRPARVVGVARDVTDERDAERRRTALLDLGDRFRDLSEADGIAGAACAALGTALGVQLVGYGLVDPAAETVAVERDWTSGGVRSLAGTLTFRDVGSSIDDFEGGATVVVEDARLDGRMRAVAAALEARGARAFVNAPVFERGSFVALLHVSTVEARRWSADELEFIREVAARTRAATARLIAEGERRAAEADLRLVLDGLPLLVAFVDRTLTYRVANARYRDWFDLAPEEVVGRRIPDLLSPDGFAARRPAIERALAGTPARLDLLWPWPDGRRRIADIRYTPRLDARGAVDGFYVAVADVTAQRDAEALLAAETLTLAGEVAERTAERDRLWDTTNDLMGAAGFDGVMKAVNPAWTAVLGWTEAELLSRPFAEIIDPADRAETAAVVRRLAAGETVTGFIDRLVTRAGETRVMMWTAVPDPGRGVFHVVGRDLTEQRRTEEALRQSQKMEAVGQLTGGLAHDFNNLLTGITGSLDMIERRIAQGRLADVERYAAVAQGSAKRAAALTHRLLAFSRRQTLDPKPTDVGRLIAGMEDMIRRTVGPAVRVEVVHAGGLWPTLVDPNQLENALLNLAINARDAMPEGGRLTIETANRRLDRRAARERDLSPGEYVSLCVSDTGTGMPAEVIAKAFDPFFTTKPLGQGTGLGLSMIYGFARQSGGGARISSEVGQGATVCLALPRHLGEADAAEQPPGVDAASRAGAGETVLIVDDEASIRGLVLELLRDLGYAAVEAADGASGLKVLQSDARVDLLVTDVGLPGGMNGRQLADAARVFRPGLKVLFITGYAENAVVGDGHLEPGMHIMTKPFALEALASRMRELIAAP